jgi:hypothetical protein
MRPDELERRLPERLAASDRFPRAGLLHVLMLPDFEGADRIGGLGEPEDPDVRRAVDRLRGGSDASGRARRDAAGKRGQQVAEQSQGWRHMNRLMRPTLLTFVISLVGWGLIAVWDEDSRAIASWMLTWQRIALDVAIVSGLVMLALLVYAAWERLSR